MDVATTPPLAAFPRPTLGRQFSTPLPPTYTEDEAFGAPAFMRQRSAPGNSPREGRNASDGDKVTSNVSESEGFPPSLGSGGNQSSAGKKSAIARMRAIGSIRGMRALGSTLSSSDSQADHLTSLNMEEPPLRGNEEVRRLMNHAVRYFNLNPKKCMEYLKEKRIIHDKRDPPAVNSRRAALFLKNTKGLNKVKIGTLLCNDLGLLRDYIGTFDFGAFDADVLGVEAGLRDVLRHFKPMGEGQHVDRVLETFALYFAEHCGPNLTQDEVYSMAWIVIMLNVELHNPNLKSNRHKVTKDSFVSNYLNEKGIGERVTRFHLEKLFENVQISEIRHIDDRDDVAGNLFADADVSGWLEMKTISAKALFPALHARWIRKFCVLSNQAIYFFKSDTDVDFEGFVTLDNLKLLTEQEPTHHSLLRSFRSSNPFHRSEVTTALKSYSSSAVPPQQQEVKPSPSTSHDPMKRLSNVFESSERFTTESSPLSSKSLSEIRLNDSTFQKTRISKSSLDLTAEADSATTTKASVELDAIHERINGTVSRETDSLLMGNSPTPGQTVSPKPTPPMPRLARLVSCPGFTRSQSSLNSSSAATTSTTSKFLWASPPSFKKKSRPAPLDSHSAFLLAPIDDRFFVRGARLNKSARSKKSNVVQVQFFYVAFRTRSRDLYDQWVKTLKQTGLIRGRAAVSFYKSISKTRYWGGRKHANKFRLTSPNASLPLSFSAEEDTEEEEVDEVPVLLRPLKTPRLPQTEFIASSIDVEFSNTQAMTKAPVLNEALALA